MKRSDEDEDRGVGEPDLQHPTGDQAEDGPADSATKADHPCNGAHNREGEDICGQRHDEPRPCLLTEEGNAKQHDSCLHR